MAHTMNSLTVLLLATLICGTFYSVSPASTIRAQTGSTQSDVVTSSTAPPLTLSGILSNIEKGIINGPVDLLESVRDQVRDIVQNVINVLILAAEPLVEDIDSTIDQLCTLAAPTNTSSRRRRDLLGLIPSNVRLLLPSNLSHLIETPINATTGQLRGIANETVLLLEQFLITEGIPWLHYTLDRLNSTHLLPNILSSIINRFDVLYNAMEILGYVGS